MTTDPLPTTTAAIAANLPFNRPAAPADSARQEAQRDVINRLKRIEGQVRGLIVMVEAERSCEDVAQQMAAARKAMDRAFFRMMACSMLEGFVANQNGGQALREVERSARILEKYA